MSFLRIQDLYKSFDRVVAVDRLNLEVREGAFFTLLGSSGCGKTTTLRLVGGLEKPDGGEIWPVTYSRVDERLPGLSRDGLRLAFVRRSVDKDAVVVMDLARGSETALEEPPAGEAHEQCEHRGHGPASVHGLPRWGST